MKRVIVIGCSGSGKSTLAKIIGAKTGLPVYHLDTLYWQPGWIQPQDETDFQIRVREVIAQEHWIIDGGFTAGNAPERFSRADTVVLFDLSRWVCLWRVFKRLMTYYGKTRPDLPAGCPEKVDLEFYRYIWTYRKDRFPRIIHYIETHFTGQLIRINSQRSRVEFINTVGAEGGRGSLRNFGEFR